MTVNVQQEESCGGILSFNINILVVILFYSFARCYFGRNWVKGMWASRHYLLQLYVNLQLSPHLSARTCCAHKASGDSKGPP